MNVRWRAAWGLLLVLVAGSAHAHPHAWIDLRVVVVFDTAGELQALRQTWVFDPSYSQLLLEGMETTRPGLDLEPALRQLRQRLLGNLRDYDYFTELRRGAQTLAIADARADTLSWRQGRLYLEFEVPVPGMRPNAEQPLEYRVYDPSYWIEVLHDPDDVIHLQGGHWQDGRGCQTRLEPPRPEGRLVAYAATLNRQQRTPMEDLGRAFAERVSIHCGP